MWSLFGLTLLGSDVIPNIFEPTNGPIIVKRRIFRKLLSASHDEDFEEKREIIYNGVGAVCQIPEGYAILRNGINVDVVDFQKIGFPPTTWPVLRWDDG